jgi:hypothetical protein
MLYNLLLSDIVEISIYSTSIFIFCKWLATDKTKNLLLYFFAYCTLALCAWIAQLPTLTPFLFTYAPIALLLFIVLHEKTLQRNLVTLCSITPARDASSDWIDTVLSSCLTTINANKLITIVIEQNNALDHFLNAPFVINADINKEIFDLLLTSTSYDENKLIWITSKGQIRGINVDWIADQNTQNEALFYTTQSDALILHAHPINRMFMLTYNGKEIKNLSAHHIRTLIKKQLSPISSLKRKGAYRESNTTEKSISG